MKANKVWTLIGIVNDTRIYKVNDQFVTKKSVCDKSYGFSHIEKTYSTYEDAIAAV